MCFTSDKANQAPYPKPDGYDPRRYDLLARYLVALQAAGRAAGWEDMVMPSPLRNEKFDVNNHGPVSTDGINANWDYAMRVISEERRSSRSNISMKRDFSIFLRTIRACLQTCKTRSISLGWPRMNLRIRTIGRGNIMFAKRAACWANMCSRSTMSLKTLQSRIRIGAKRSYQMDSHNEQRVVTPDGAVVNEGDMYLPVKPWRSLIAVLFPSAARR